MLALCFPKSPSVSKRVFADIPAMEHMGNDSTRGQRYLLAAAPIGVLAYVHGYVAFASTSETVSEIVTGTLNIATKVGVLFAPSELKTND
jgi:hypothetical protein